MKITAIQISDFLSLEDVALEPNDKRNVFVGKNRQGKTSILKAINVGFNGTNDDTVIRDDAGQAKIFIELDNGDMTIDRTIRRGATNRLTVKGRMTMPDGEKVFQNLPSPQEQLTRITSQYTFDPIEFVLLAGAARVKYFQSRFPAKLKPEDLKDKVSNELFAKINFEDDAMSILLQIKNEIYPARTIINKMAKQKKTIYEVGMKSLGTFDPDTYKDRVEEYDGVARGLESRLTEAKTIIAQNETANKHIAVVKNKITDINIELDSIDEEKIATIPKAEAFIKKTQEEVAVLLEAIAVAQKDLTESEQIRDKRDRLKDDIKRHEETIASYPDTSKAPDVIEIEDRLRDAIGELAVEKSRQSSYRDYVELQAVKDEYEASETDSAVLSDILTYIGKDLPAKIAQEANYPIKDIVIDGDKMFIGGISIDNCSTKEGVEIGLNIVRATTPANGLKTICLDRAESLDDESLKEFISQIDADEFQYWITKVEHEGEVIPLGAYRVTGGAVAKIT